MVECAPHDQFTIMELGASYGHGYVPARSSHRAPDAPRYG